MTQKKVWLIFEQSVWAHPLNFYSAGALAAAAAALRNGPLAFLG